MFKQEYLDGLNPDLEKIKFTSKKSKLATDLISLMKQYKKDNSIVHINKMARVCTEHFNIRTYINIINENEPNAFFYFGFPKSLKLTLGLQVNSRSSGRGFRLRNGDLNEFVENIGDYVTEDKGTLSNNILKNTDVTFQIGLHKGLIKLMDPGEIIAVTLHELGHGSTMLKRAGDSYNKIYEAQDMIKKEMSNKKNEQDIINHLNNIKGTPNSVIGALFSLPVAVISFVSILGIFTAMKLSPVGVIVGYIGSLIITNLYMRVFSKFASEFEMMGDKEKKSELLAGQYNILYTERWADEFAVQHGLGYELSSGLSKFQTKGANVSSNSKNLRDTLGILLLPNLMTNDVKAKYGELHERHELHYEAIVKRIENNLMNMYQHFKSSDIDPKFKRLYIEDVKKTEKLLEENKVIFKENMKNALKVETGLDKVVKSIENKNSKKAIKADMYFLNNDIERLIKNSFYFKSNEILSLID